MRDLLQILVAFLVVLALAGCPEDVWLPRCPDLAADLAADALDSGADAETVETDADAPGEDAEPPETDAEVPTDAAVD